MPEHARSPRDPNNPGTPALRVPPVEEWDSWPFAGPVVPKQLRPPEPEPDRHGEGARPCNVCSLGDDAYAWTDANWRLHALPPSGLPLVLLLEPRLHVDGPRDLPDHLLAEMGILLARVERALLTVPGVERVHLLRIGEGTAHLHWWCMGRPTGLRQVASGFAQIWDDVLPVTPADVHAANVPAVVAALGKA